MFTAFSGHGDLMKSIFAAVLLLLVLAVPIVAHHSFSAEYDGNKSVIIKGTLKEVDWRNPHIYYMIESKETGKAVMWKVEGYPPNMLVRRPEGWTHDKVMKKVGDVVTVSGWQARTGEPAAHSRMITFSDGSTMEAGPNAGNGGPPAPRN
jgi:hypothetical protein